MESRHVALTETKFAGQITHGFPLPGFLRHLGRLEDSLARNLEAGTRERQAQSAVGDQDLLLLKSARSVPIKNRWGDCRFDPAHTGTRLLIPTKDFVIGND